MRLNGMKSAIGCRLCLCRTQGRHGICLQKKAMPFEMHQRIIPSRTFKRRITINEVRMRTRNDEPFVPVWVTLLVLVVVVLWLKVPLG